MLKSPFGPRKRTTFLEQSESEPLTYMVQLYKKGQPPSDFERFFVRAWEDAEAVGTVADIFHAIGAEPYYAVLTRDADRICTWGNLDL